jgi:hypothetical protein
MGVSHFDIRDESSDRIVNCLSSSPPFGLVDKFIPPFKVVTLITRMW